MTIFAVLLPEGDQPRLVEQIKTAYSDNYYEINSKQWLVSTNGTSGEVSAKLGIFDSNNKEAPIVGNGIVVSVANYTGRAPTPIWEWIRSKLEASVNG